MQGRECGRESASAAPADLHRAQRVLVEALACRPLILVACPVVPDGEKHVAVHGPHLFRLTQCCGGFLVSVAVS